MRSACSWRPIWPRAPTVACSAEQANYLRNVLRLKAGDPILVFNGRDGEWRAELAEAGKRGAALLVGAQVRPQEGGPDIDYLFAPLKRARLDYLVQKATEMGVARLRPVLTRRTTPERVNVERMRANAIEAAEQCGILRIPEVRAPEKLERVVAGWDAARPLIFCDEGSEERCPFATLARLQPGPLALLIGPEGGFDEAERDAALIQAIRDAHLTRAAHPARRHRRRRRSRPRERGARRLALAAASGHGLCAPALFH